jgi:hypothetical protein
LALVVLPEIVISDFLDVETCQAHPDRQREQNDYDDVFTLIDQEVYIEFVVATRWLSLCWLRESIVATGWLGLCWLRESIVATRWLGLCWLRASILN